MDNWVLVAYASKHGATAEIAARIGQVLGRDGRRAVVMPAHEVADLGPYPAVILGSAVYAGQWRKEAARFLERYAEALAERAVWLFSSGPTGEGDPLELVNGWRLPASLEATVRQIRPRDVALFHGALDRERLSLAERLIVKGVKAPLGDYRDWAAIEAWAVAIAHALSSAGMRGPREGLVWDAR
jgi:menaquinone-dependent protoporphyrinogen oxidase